MKFTIDDVRSTGTSGRMPEGVMPVIFESGGLPHLEMRNLDARPQEIEHGRADAWHQKSEPHRIREKPGCQQQNPSHKHHGPMGQRHRRIIKT